MRHWKVALLLFLSIGQLWGQMSPRDEALKQLIPLMHELVAIKALNAMRLSPDQMERLLSIVHAAQALEGNFRKRLRTVLKEQLDAFTAFRREGMINLGFTPTVEQRTAKADSESRELRKKFAKAIAALVEELETVLTPEQQAIAEQADHLPLQWVLGHCSYSADGMTQVDLVGQLRSALTETRYSRYGHLPPLGRFLLNPSLLSALEWRLGSAPPSVSFLPIMLSEDNKLAKLERNVRDLYADINLLNLVNGLNLTAEQVNGLNELARRANKLRRLSEPFIDPVAFNELVQTLQAMRERLMAGGELPRALQQRAQQLAKQAGLLVPSIDEPSMLISFIVKAEAELTDEQKRVLLGYQPCLIPPKDLKDPVRVGQVENGDGAIEALRQVRAIPDAVYRERKVALIERVAQQVDSNHSCRPPEERNGFRRRLAKLIDRVRAMDDVEFEVQREALMEELRKITSKVDFERQLQLLVSQSPKEELRSKVIANLLHPRMEVVLTERLQVMANIRPGNGEGLETLTIANVGGVCPKP